MSDAGGLRTPRRNGPRSTLHVENFSMSSPISGPVVGWQVAVSQQLLEDFPNILCQRPVGIYIVTPLPIKILGSNVVCKRLPTELGESGSSRKDGDLGFMCGHADGPPTTWSRTLVRSLDLSDV